MTSIPESDFTTVVNNLRLTQNNVTEVVFTAFEDFTGYTTERFIWCNNAGTKSLFTDVVITDVGTGEITVTFDEAAWTLIDGELSGSYQLDITDGSSNLKILAVGSTVFEPSKIYP